MRILYIIAMLLMASFPAAAHEFKVGDLVIDHPTIRETPPGAKVASGHLSVHNSGATDDRLVAIESTAIPRIEMHVSTIVDGVASMREMENGLAIPAGKTAALGEDGTHAMFMNLATRLKDGDKLDAVLVFEKAGRVPVVFNVEKRKPAGDSTHEHQ